MHAGSLTTEGGIHKPRIDPVFAAGILLYLCVERASDGIMKIRLLAIMSLLCPLLASAEIRTFTNAAGKKIKAELIGMEEGAAVLKLANGRTAKVPLKSLSEGDQSYVRSWYEENKNKVRAGDLRLTIKKNTERLKESPSGKKDKGRNNNKNNKISRTETSYLCTLENLSVKSIEGIKADYVIYERVSVRGGEDGSETRTEETSTSAELKNLKPNGTVEFTSDSEISEEGETTRKGVSESRREKVVGFVVTILIDGVEILKQSHPDNFLKRLEEDAERKAAREKESR
jgi:hypothetical protein